MYCVELQYLLKADNKDDCFSNPSSAEEGGKRFSFDNNVYVKLN